MIRTALLLVLAVLAGCSDVPRGPDTSSPCYANEASYECQIERYQNVNVD